MRVRCNACAERFFVEDYFAGQRVPCPHCQKKVSVPEPDADDDDEAPSRPQTGERKFVYLRKDERSSTDAPGMISLVFGLVALICMGMGWFTQGWTYYAGAGLALAGFGLAFLSKGNLRIADSTLNVMVLLPSIVLVTLLLAGKPVVQRAEVVAVSAAPITPKQVESADKEEPAPAPKEPVWVNAANANTVKIGDVLVAIPQVRIEVPKPSKGEPVHPTDPGRELLLVDVQVGNVSGTRKLDFKRWSRSKGGDAGRLTDNFKNSYKQFGFSALGLLDGINGIDPYKDIKGLESLLGGQGGSLLGNQSSSESLNPNSSIIDTMAFELPVDKWKVLHLELPADNFGGTGKVYFQIPRSMVR
jgi:hypothetical protein